MIQILKLSLRNLFRNWRRTLLTCAAISFGLAMMVWTINLQNGSYQEMTRNGISQMAGHVVVQAKGYQADPKPELTVSNADETTVRLAGAFPEATITQRITLAGILVSPTNNLAAGLRAIVPNAEAAIGDMDDMLVDGAWLASDDERGIIIGAGMAETLSAAVGDKLVFMGQNGTEEMESRLFRVRGVFQTGGADFDGRIRFIHLEAGRALLRQPAVANQIAIHLDDARTAFQATEDTQELLARPELDIRSWREALPELYALIQVDRQSSDIMMSVIGLIVAMGVLNTVLMSVLERTRELGVLMAIGMRKRKIALMVLAEGMFLGIIGTLGGVLLGLIPSYYTVAYGLDFSQWMGESFETNGIAMSAVMHGAWDPRRMGIYAAGAVCFTILAAIYPAWRVTRLQPVDAMRAH